MDISDRIQIIIKNLVGEHRGAIAEFARMCGFRTGHVNEWIQKRAKPGAVNRNKICAIYNLSRTWLDTGEGEMLSSVPGITHATILSERDIGRLEGEIKALKDQVDKYEKRMDFYDREILITLKAYKEKTP